MLNKFFVLSAIALTSACASQGGQNTAKSTEPTDSNRVDEAFHDGRCSAEEARRGDSPDCQQQNARRTEQRQDPFSDTRQSLEQLGTDSFGLDRNLPGAGDQGLLR